MAYFLPDKTQRSILDTVRSFTKILRRQYGLQISQFQTDGERGLGNEWKRWIEDHGYIHHTMPPYTHEPNGGIERSGGVMKVKAIALQLTSALPADLWPEYWAAAVYIYNRSPRRSNG